MIVGWQKGAFRKTTQIEVIATEQISGAEMTAGTASGAGGALLMTVTTLSTTVTFALPRGRTDIGEAIRATLIVPTP
jgi:hypothetical protein